MSDFVELSELFEIDTVRTPGAALVVRIGSSGCPSTTDRVRDVPASFSRDEALWLTPGKLTGDAPDKYNPAYVAAVLSASLENSPTGASRLPRIVFSTDEATRRSMTLNGMRMTLEFRQTGSRRLLELVQNRLALGQRDVIHDVLVYHMNAIWDLRAEERAERSLRVESVAAYLGLEQDAVTALFAAPVLDADEIATKIKNGEAGTPRRTLDPTPLLENQLALLQPELVVYRAQESELLDLMREIVELLTANLTGPG